MWTIANRSDLGSFCEHLVRIVHSLNHTFLIYRGGAMCSIYLWYLAFYLHWSVCVVASLVNTTVVIHTLSVDAVSCAVQ